MPILFGIMIDEVVYYQNLSNFIKLSLIFVVMSIFSCVLYFFIYAQHHYLMSMFTFDIKMDLFEHLQKCDAQYMTDLSTGDTIEMIRWYSQECMHFLIRNVIHSFNNFLSIIAVIIYLFVISWQIGVFILIAAPITVYISTTFGKKIRKYGDIKREYYGSYISWVFECLSALRDIRMLGTISKANASFEENHRNMFAVNIKSEISMITANNMIDFANLVTRLSILLLPGG